MVRRQLHPNWTAIYDDQEAASEEERAKRQALFVGHGEDAIPAGRRLIEEIFLAALPIGEGGAVIGPLVQNGLERVLRVLPAAPAVELVGLLKKVDALTHFVRGAVSGIFRSAADEFVNGYRLELALGGGIRGFVDDDVRAVVFIQSFQARGEIHSVA